MTIEDVGVPELASCWAPSADTSGPAGGGGCKSWRRGSWGTVVVVVVVSSQGCGWVDETPS